jgi:exonuclease SbcD
MISFIHTADIHFGMENYGRIDPQTGIHTRLLDFERAFNACISYAIEQQVDFFLFSGDAYKTAHPTPTQQKLLLRCFLRLYQAGIPTIIIVGNHDQAVSHGKAHALELFNQLPVDGFHVVARPETIRLKTKNGVVNIVGIPWPSRSTLALNALESYETTDELTGQISLTLARAIRQMADTLPPEEPAVLAGHLTVSSGVFSGSEKRAIYGSDPLFLISDLAIPPFDYVALGHLHRYQNLNPTGIPVVYAGSIERVDFGERNEEKGFCHVTIHDKAVTEHRFIKSPMRPFIQIDVQLDMLSPHTEQIVRAIRDQVIDDAIIKIVYQVPAGEQDRVNLPAVHNACTQAHYIAGIIAVRTPVARQKRATFSPQEAQAVRVQSTQALLRQYLTSKQIAAEKQEAALTLAQQLLAKVGQEDQSN